MRIIRTEMYFDSSRIEGLVGKAHAQNPGISLAWCAIDSNDLARLSSNIKIVPYLEKFRPVAFRPNGYEPDDNLIRNFLSASIQGAANSKMSHLLQSGVRENNQIAEFVLSQDVVIERSPPKAIPFKKLVGGATHITIGAYIGVSIAGANPLLMLVTVPGGILIIGAAISVSRALDKGINKSIEHWFKKRLR